MNTKKGLVRKRKRMEEKVKLQLRQRQLEALTLKQWKVGVITMGLHNFTIMAADEQSAVDKVMKQKGGRDAGKEGPVPIGFRVQDMSIVSPSAPLQQVIAEVLKGDMSNAPEQGDNYCSPGSNPAEAPKSIITPGR